MYATNCLIEYTESIVDAFAWNCYWAWIHCRHIPTPFCYWPLIIDKIRKNATDASALKKKETIENKNAFMLNIYNMKAKKTKSGWLDSNQRPHAPQTRTLTGLSYIPYCECKSSTFWRMHQIFRQLFFEFNKKMRHLPVMSWDDGGCGYVSRRGTYKIFPHFLWMKLFTNRTQKERLRLNFIKVQTTSLCRLFHTVFWHYFWREE